MIQSGSFFFCFFFSKFHHRRSLGEESARPGAAVAVAPVGWGVLAVVVRRVGILRAGHHAASPATHCV